MDFSNLGYDKPLYILPFDHRSTFAEHMFGLKSLSELSAGQVNLIKNFKLLVYKGFKEALNKGIPKEDAAILCDEQFGSEVLEDAGENGYITLLTIEKSGQNEFEFEYGGDFGKHIEEFNPTFTKVLIKYNPEDPDGLKEKQKNNLKIISDYSHKNGYKFLLEVLVLPTNGQMQKAGEVRENYDMEIRPSLTVEVIKDLQSFGIEPDVWKMEGLERTGDYGEIMETIRTGGRDKVSLVILGRGAGEEKVDEWLKTGAKVEGVTGFAVGRTVFWDALEKHYRKEITDDEVIKTVGENFYKFYNIFVSSKVY